MAAGCKRAPFKIKKIKIKTIIFPLPPEIREQVYIDKLS